ncbi:MAG: PQQ-dependent sugar dehydrogenase [Chloroflexota bacterium]
MVRNIKLNPGPARAAGLAIASMLLVAGGTAIAGNGTLPLTGQTPGAGGGGSPAPVVNVSAPFDPSAVSISLQEVAAGLSNPVLVTNANDGSGRLFVVEQSGKIRIVKNGSVLTTPFLDLTPSVSTGNEQGLLGLAFHPSFKTNGRFFVDLTLANGDTAINEYRVTTDPDRADWRTGKRILTIAQPYDNHNGGHIAFGPDGFLYIATGDGGSAGDPGNRAQSLTTLLGKLLRIDVNGTSGTRNYRIPASNPFVNKAGYDGIWSYGLRNPWRFSFDRATGHLFIGDVGQDSWEEIDRGTSATPGRGVNFGWRVLEGRHCYNPSTGCTSAGKWPPLVAYGHAVTGEDNCSVTGGYVYRGAQTILQGGYFFADFCSGRIWAVDSAATSPATPKLLLDTTYNISSFGEDQAGEVYVADHTGGRIYRIVGAAA